MQKKKWQIDNLDNNLAFSSAADIILKNRLDQVMDDIKNYFESESAEGLHRIRISLRRFRYSMELFVSCYDSKIFMILYKKVTKLQDLSGQVRDFDVMEENINSMANHQDIKIPKKVFRKLEELRNEYKVKLKQELKKFTAGKAVKNLEQLL